MCVCVRERERERERAPIMVRTMEDTERDRQTDKDRQTVIGRQTETDRDINKVLTGFDDDDGSSRKARIKNCQRRNRRK